MESLHFIWYRNILFGVYILRCLPRFTLLVLQNMICPPIFCFWFFLCWPIKCFSQQFFYWMFGKLFDAYLVIVSSWLDFSGHSVYECGDDISHIIHDETLLIVNHQSPTDIGTMMRVLQEKNNAFSRVVWIMDWLIQFLHFGWVAKLHGDFFLLQTNDAKRLAKIYSFDIEASNQCQPIYLRHNIRHNFYNRDKKWIILFPEGGFLRKRLKGSHRFAERNSLPLLHNVTLPRTKAFRTIFDALGVSNCSRDSFGNIIEKNGGNLESKGSHPLKWIVDVTIGYDKPIGIMEYMLGATGPRQVIVHYKCFPVSDVLDRNVALSDTEKEVKLRDWLFKRFIIKEDLLSYFYQYHNFPAFDKSESTSRLRFPKLNFLVLALIQLASFGTFYIIVLLYFHFRYYN